MRNNEIGTSPFDALPNQAHAKWMAIAFVTARTWDDVYASLRAFSRLYDMRSLSSYLDGRFFARYAEQSDADAMLQLQSMADKYLKQPL